MQWPIDFESLKKGDVITQEWLERYLLVRAESGVDRYRLKCLAFAQEIERRTRLHAVVRGSDIRILTDAESSQACDEYQQRCVQGIRSAYTRLARVDETEFDPELRRKHESRLLLSSAYVISLEKAKRKRLLEARAQKALKGE